MSDQQTIKRRLRYLRGTASWGITYKREEDRQFFCFTDADFAGAPVTYRSGGPIAWQSELQENAVTSTTEAEFMAISSATKNIPRDIGKELKAVDREEPVPLFLDNQRAVLVASNEKSKQRTRHLGAQLRFGQEIHEKQLIDVQYIAAQDQRTDILTKLLACTKYTRNRNLHMSLIMVLLMMMCLILMTLSNHIQGGEYMNQSIEPLNRVLLVQTAHYVRAGFEELRVIVEKRDHCGRWRHAM